MPLFLAFGITHFLDKPFRSSPTKVLSVVFLPIALAIRYKTIGKTLLEYAKNPLSTKDVTRVIYFRVKKFKTQTAGWKVNTLLSKLQMELKTDFF